MVVIGLFSCVQAFSIRPSRAARRAPGDPSYGRVSPLQRPIPPDSLPISHRATNYGAIRG
jgi:hypothetical protein